jgi:tRNA (guanine-N7-)-methyltransferase
MMSAALPALRIDLSNPPPAPLTTLFAAPVSEVWLEIGFGGGEHLIAQAQRNPSVGFIGAEPFLNGVAKVVARAADLELGNVRVLDGDARPLVAWLPDASIARVFILFPDPWPKRRHDDRRIVSEALVAKLSRVMRPGGKLTIASDIEAYIRAVNALMAAAPAFAAVPRDPLLRPDDWVPTRYEEKAIAAGRTCRYLEFARL